MPRDLYYAASSSLEAKKLGNLEFFSHSILLFSLAYALFESMHQFLFHFVSCIFFFFFVESETSSHKRKPPQTQKALRDHLFLDILISSTLKRAKVPKALTPKKVNPPKASSKLKKSAPSTRLCGLSRSACFCTVVQQHFTH